LAQSTFGNLPSGCTVSGHTITCSVSFDLSSGDTILATWYEPSRSTSLSDNGGSIVVDVYGYGTASPTPSPLPSPLPLVTPSPTPNPTPDPTPIPLPMVTPSPTPSPTADPTPSGPAPQPAPAPAVGVAAVGDPHLQNIRGDRFDLMKAGKHVLINIPRGMSAENALLRVQAVARRLGGHCADMYFQELNITGSWAEAKQAGGYHHSILQYDAEIPQWVAFGKVELKVVHGRTQSGLLYLNVYVKHLGRAGFAVGGLLGEDDHSDVVTPPAACAKQMSLAEGRGAEGSSAASVATAVLA